LLAKANIRLPVFKKYCYSDKSGKYVLYLTEKNDKPFPEQILSTSIEAHLLKISEENSLIPQWTIRDFSASGEAGMNFRSKLVELIDIDKDGLVEPILVYRFFNKNYNGVNTDGFSGRIKIIMFYRGKKIAIRAYTGQLDGERGTIANDSFFTLPKSVQKYLVQKMADMYEKDLFGFDNSHNFLPLKEKRSEIPRK